MRDLFSKIIEIDQNTEGEILYSEELGINRMNEKRNVPPVKEEHLNCRYKEGTIFYREKQNTWEARITVEGKQVYVGKRKTKADAFLLLKEAIRQKSKGTFEHNTKPSYTVKTWVNEWIELYKKDKIKTWKALYGIFENHVFPKFGDIPINALSKIELQKHFNGMHSSRMREDAYKYLNASLKKALKLKLIKENPCDDVEVIAHIRTPGEALTIEQQAEFLKIIREYSHIPEIYYFYLLTGCRVGEAFREKWEHVDMQGQTLFIDGTKTKTSQRYIPLFEELGKLLSRMIRKNEYIFPFSRSTLSRDWENVQSHLSFPFELKNTRQTFATRHWESGVPEKIVSVWLGHSSLKMTNKVYITTLPEFSHEQRGKRKDITVDELINGTNYGTNDEEFLNKKQ